MSGDLRALLRKVASDPVVIAKVQWRLDHYGPRDAEPFRWSRYESEAHAALSVLTDEDSLIEIALDGDPT